MARMLLDGQWVERSSRREIRRPYDGEVVDDVPEASAADADAALTAAVQGAAEMRSLTPSRRMEILSRAAELVAAQLEEFAALISAEVGKPISEARAEAARAPDLLRLCGTEGAQIRGETLPLDPAPDHYGRLGLTIPVPSGVVLAITPFNYPLLLVVHKIGPALAAGNAVILKPASSTPLTALRLAGLLLEAGLPPRGLQVITGLGAAVGSLMAADPRVRKVTFTGSAAAGVAVGKAAAGKPVSLELGSVCPAIVLRDADLDVAAAAIATGGYVNAGQVCISTQRVLAAAEVVDPLVELIHGRVAAIQTGDPRLESTRLGPLITEAEAVRVLAMTAEAVANGAHVVTGGDRQGALLSPLVIRDVPAGSSLAREELFGPAVAVTTVSGIDEALAEANANRYGLAAGLFTSDYSAAVRFAHEAQYGIVQINSSPTWRADFMPYGGLKDSGFGREGPRYAVAEMTEIKTVIFHGGMRQA